MEKNFIHLNCHTEYSMFDSLVRINHLANNLLDQNIPSFALTDHVNMFGMVKFYKALQSKGVKPIIGSELQISGDHGGRLTLLCQNKIGYKNIIKLISKAYMEGQVNGQPYVNFSWLNGNTEGLIALSGGQFGALGKYLLGGNKDKAIELNKIFNKLFPNSFYIELHRCNRVNDENHLHAAIELAIATGTPVVATNDVRFIDKEDFYAHEIRVCIHNKTYINNKRNTIYSKEQYLKSMEQMSMLFQDIPSAIENTWNIAKRCNIELTLGNNYLPDFPIPKNNNIQGYFINKARRCLRDRMQGDIPQQYLDRLEEELKVIIDMGFAGYFLIVADFIQWSKQNNIPVGPGRGSGAGSLVAYSLGITNIDPLPYNLLFERFLNPERVSMPDFDIDFCIEGRDAVIDYVAKRYGRDRVSQIITYGTMAAKAVVRDVGRVLGYPYGFTDRISKLIPKDPGIKIDHAIEDSKELKELYEKEKDAKELIDLSRKLEGISRNAGKHAGGVVIAPTSLTEYTPIYCDGSDILTQFDKGDVEDIGLVKFDFLGLKTLTVIKWALENISEPIDIDNIPLDDRHTFEKVFKTAQTTGVFQLESTGIKRLVKAMSADCFEDIIALVALYRPGPLQSGMVDDFVNRKHGRSAITYIHESLETILKNTYGVIVYQEQVMQIAQVLAGYTLGEADLLRRAMGKKKPEEMAKQRSIFIDGARKNNISVGISTEIFDLMEKFAGYGFNKSHSAGYALISYQTAWLKTHYPSEFMAATLSSEMDNLDKLAHIIRDCHYLGIMVLPPNINTSEYRFKAIDKETILYGLGALKGNGDNSTIKIIEERNKRGFFKNLVDLCNRVILTKKNAEIFTKSGSLDALELNRSTTMHALSWLMLEAKKTKKQRGQIDMFGKSDEKIEIEEKKEWDELFKLKCEKEVLGVYMSGHPFSLFKDELLMMCPVRIKDLSHDIRNNDKHHKVAGWCCDVNTFTTKKGELMSKITIEDDEYSSVDVIIYPELYEFAKHAIKSESIIIIEGMINYDYNTDEMELIANLVMGLTQARESFLKGIEINVTDKNKSKTEWILNRYPGNCPVYIKGVLTGKLYKTNPQNQLIEELDMEHGIENIRLFY